MDFNIETADLISIFMSVVCGGLIGLEREYKNKSTGLRTIVLICLGSTIFTIVSRHGQGADDRISANIITGIGFIGAGVIFKDKLSVLGLTTAAVIWTTAAIGMTTGIGYHSLALLFTAITLVVLLLVNRVEKLVNRMQKSRVYTITFADGRLERVEELEQRIAKCGLRGRRLQLSKSNHTISVMMELTGKPAAIQQITWQLAGMEEISDFYSG